VLGCVGCRAGQQPLSRTIPELTAIAALDDPRAAGRNWSSSEVGIEVSLLTPMKRVPGPEGLQPGEHGGYVESGACRALLLPQVASRLPYSTREGFLRALAHKAGLSPKIYREPETRLYVFRTQVFGQGD
jgi:AMMECR1 domain-containing protein